MKVALAFPGCHRRGGVERVVFECARFLAGRGYDVNVFASEWEADPDHLIQYHQVKMSRGPAFRRLSSYFQNSAAQIVNYGCDVLNTHGCVCPTGGVHWVHSVHRAWLERCRGFRPPHSWGRLKQRLNPLHPLLLRMEEAHFRKRDYRKVIALTEQVRSDLKRFYDVPEQDVCVISNGFSPSEFNPTRRAEMREAARTQLGLMPEHFVLLFAANELERKGYRTVLDALRRLNDPRLRLLVVGRSPVEEVRRQAAKFGVLSQVIANGSTSEMVKYHAAADVFVLPTQYEALCLAILEALGSGLPVITSNVPGARDAIKSGVNGLLISEPTSGLEFANAVEYLLDGDACARFSAAAPATVEMYQWPKVLLRYEQVLSQSSRPS